MFVLNAIFITFFRFKQRNKTKTYKKDKAKIKRRKKIKIKRRLIIYHFRNRIIKQQLKNKKAKVEKIVNLIGNNIQHLFHNKLISKAK